MGGCVSFGRNNNELIDNLVKANYIKSRSVERVFRALDRSDYMTLVTRFKAYKDLSWRDGHLRLYPPFLYSSVMEALELHPGLSFLHVGSGTGYLTTLVGLIIGSSGISHGIELHPVVVEYATKKLGQFMENSTTLDEFDFCEPKYYSGNGLCLAPLQAPYDRVYCECECPEEYQNYFNQLIKVGGILVMPLNKKLVKIWRVSENEWVSRSLVPFSFTPLRKPTKEEAAELIRLDELCPPKLQLLARSVIRSTMRAVYLRLPAELRESLQGAPPTDKSYQRRPNEEGLNDLDSARRHERIALLRLMLALQRDCKTESESCKKIAHKENPMLCLLLQDCHDRRSSHDSWSSDSTDVNSLLRWDLRRDDEESGDDDKSGDDKSGDEDESGDDKSGDEDESGDDKLGDTDDGGSGGSAEGGSPRSAGSPPLKSSETVRWSPPSASATASTAASAAACTFSSSAAASTAASSAAASTSASPGKDDSRTDLKPFTRRGSK